MQTITDHKVNGLNEALEITADEPGSGGASHEYEIRLVVNGNNATPDSGYCAPSVNVVQARLKFQYGPIAKPEDFNGLTNEALLAVLIHRMRGFQSGKFACRENAVALTKLEEALMWLQKRTNDRMKRGVEGTLTP